MQHAQHAFSQSLAAGPGGAGAVASGRTGGASASAADTRVPVLSSGFTSHHSHNAHPEQQQALASLLSAQLLQQQQQLQGGGDGDEPAHVQAQPPAAPAADLQKVVGALQVLHQLQDLISGLLVAQVQQQVQAQVPEPEPEPEMPAGAAQLPAGLQALAELQQAQEADSQQSMIAQLLAALSQQQQEQKHPVQPARAPAALPLQAAHPAAAAAAAAGPYHGVKIEDVMQEPAAVPGEQQLQALLRRWAGALQQQAELGL